MRGWTFASQNAQEGRTMTDRLDEIKARPAPPGLIITGPDCSVCWRETHVEDDTYVCQHCGFFWDINNPEDPGELIDPETPACGATAKPYADNPYCSDEARARVYTCVLDANHHDDDGEHRGLDEHGNVAHWTQGAAVEVTA
jgi:hypothetical protein